MNEPQKSIGVFDSGIGGLTAMKELLRTLPNEDIIYFGDTARVPYGSHSPETIRKFARQDLGFLLSQSVKAVLIACGTVSSTAIDALREMTDIPIVGVIDAAALRAVKESKNGKIAVLATQATIRSHAYRNAIKQQNTDCLVIEKACPLFVPLIENGYSDRKNPVTRMVVEDYLKEVIPFEADTVILGCTHYPLIKDIINDYLPNANVVEAGKEAAVRLGTVLDNMSLKNKPTHKGIRRYVVSEKTYSFKDTCEFFLGEQIDEAIEVINLE